MKTQGQRDKLVSRFYAKPSSIHIASKGRVIWCSNLSTKPPRTGVETQTKTVTKLRWNLVYLIHKINPTTASLKLLAICSFSLVNSILFQKRKRKKIKHFRMNPLLKIEREFLHNFSTPHVLA